MSKSTPTEAIVTSVEAMAPGTMKMAHVGEHRVVVIRTATGFHALDNACPHQGYGLATGALDGDLITCQWHNWKYRVTDGRCVQGEEDVACHPVRVEGDDVIVTVTRPEPEAQRAVLWPSLRQAIDRFYTGQIARDTARLLAAGATPEQIIADALARGIPRTEWGLGHELAVTADLLHLSDSYQGIDKAIPLVQALAGISEETRDRTPHPDAEPVDAAPDCTAFVVAIEAEDWAKAVAALRALGERFDVATVRAWVIEAVSRHHYNYGHGAIYTQKAFELIDRVPQLAPMLAEELALMLTLGTREDVLPYMRKAMREIDAVDLDALAGAGAERDPSARHTPEWITERDRLVARLLNADQAPIAELVEGVVGDGAPGAHAPGVPGLLDIVSLAASHRLLRYDLDMEFDDNEPFGWLDITHVLTYANAARWAWQVHPGPASARLALMTAFLAYDSGRAERRNAATHAPLPEARPGNVTEAIRRGKVDDAVAHALAGPPDDVADELERASVGDGGGSFIVAAHLVKTAVAARREAAATGSLLPLAATARFMAGPRRERFVARNTLEALDFVRTGQPPKR